MLLVVKQKNSILVSLQLREIKADRQGCWADTGSRASQRLIAETLACPISGKRIIDESNVAVALWPMKILTKPLDKALPAESAKSRIIPETDGLPILSSTDTKTKKALQFMI